MCHNLDSKPPPDTCRVFLAVVRHLPAALAGAQPSLRGPVVFRYFSWPVKFLTRMIDFGRRQQVNFQSNSLEVNLTITTSQQQGSMGKMGANSSHILLNGVKVILLIARDVLKLDYSFNLSVLMITCCRVAVISNLCPCCCKVLTVPAT